MIITVADTQLPDDQDDGPWFDTSNSHAVATATSRGQPSGRCVPWW